MPIYKCSMLISFITTPQNRAVSSPHAGGWSEQIWRSGVPFTNPEAFSLCNLRSILLPLTATVIGLRQQAYNIVGNKLQPGGANTFPVNLAGSRGLSFNNPQSALLLRITSAGVPNVGRYTIRGLPDEVMVDGEYDPTPNFSNGLNNFRAEIALPGRGFVGRNLAGAFANCMGSNGTGMLVSSTAGFAQNDFVRFVDIHGPTGASISGTFQISIVGPGNLLTFVGGAGKDALPGGKIRLDGLSFLQTSIVTIGRASVRKVGRPFGGYAGRRSKRRRVG